MKTFSSLLTGVAALLALGSSATLQTGGEWSPAPRLSIGDAAGGSFEGSVLAVKEGMRVLIGAITPQQEAAFEAKWANAERYPSAAMEEYCAKLAPLLEEYLSLKEVVAAAAASQQASWDEALSMAGFGSELGTRRALEEARLCELNLQGVVARMKAIAAEVEKLGPPPVPANEAGKARKRHQDALDVAKQSAPAVSFTATPLKAAPNQAVTFKPVLRGVPAGSQLVWTFGDGATTKGGLVSVSHKYAKAGKFSATVAVLPKGKKQVPSGVKRTITVAGAPTAAGTWVLRKIERQPQPYSAAYTIRPKFDVTDTGVSYALHLPAAGGWYGGKPVLDVGVAAGMQWSPMPAVLKPGEVWEPDLTLQVTLTGDENSLMAQAYYTGNILELAVHSNIPVTKVSQADGKTTTSEVPYIIHSAEGPGYPDKSAWIYKIAPGTYTLRDKMGKIRLQPGYKHWVARAPEGASGKTWTVMFRPSVNARYNERCEARIFYHYQYGASGAAPPVASAGPSPAELMKQAKLEEIRSYIAYIDETIRRLQAARATEQDPLKQRDLDYQIMQAQTSRQAEQDLYDSIDKGVYVRSRTPFDDYAQAHFIHGIRENQLRMEEAQRMQAALLRLADLHPTMSEELKRKVLDQLIGQGLAAKGDLASIRRLAEAVSNQVQGYWEGERAKQDEKAIDAEENIFWCKTVIAASTMILSAGASELGAAYAAPSWLPVAGTMTYAGATGYIESGDPAEAIKQSVSWSHKVAMMGIAAWDGYQAGGWQGSVTDLAKGAAIGWLTGKARQLAVSTFGTGPAFKLPPGAPQPGMSARQFIDSAAYRKEQATGRTKVGSLEKARDALQKAVDRKASPGDLKKLEDQLEKQMIEVMADQHGKMFLLKSGMADPRTVAAYEQVLKRLVPKIQSKFDELMRAKGFASQETMPVRNATSKGTAGADLDLALVEKGLILRNGKRVSVAEWQREANVAFEDALKTVTGKTSKQLWANITSSVHMESYKDAGDPSRGVFEGWLSDLRNPQNRAALQKVWAQQAGSVTTGKAWEMTNHQGLSRFSAMQEVARGTAKDIKTKLQPILDAVKPANPQAGERLRQAKAQWREVGDLMEAFGNGKVGPITAHHRLRRVTGRDSFVEVAEDFRAVLEGLLKFS